MKKDMHIMIGICIILLCTAVFLFIRGQKNVVQTEEFIVSSEASSEEKPEKSDKNTKKKKEKECAVYIIGAVKHPGLYRYTGNARVHDAVEALGGFTKNAARDSVNLAEFLKDGEQITILTRKQAEKADKKRVSQKRDAAEDTAGRVDLNQASKEELLTLPGIGEAKALLIIQYRTEHGAFSKPEDIMQISGIKEGIYQKIKDLITTS